MGVDPKPDEGEEEDTEDDNPTASRAKEDKKPVISNGGNGELKEPRPTSS